MAPDDPPISVIEIRTQEVALALERCGTGPPLLFLGGTGWDLRSPPSPLSSSLIRHFDVAIYDQRGLGRSDKPQGPYSMDSYARDAIGVLDALAWQQAHVVGYSFGGMVAQELAIRWPERISALVLAVTSPGGRGGASYPIESLASLPARQQAIRSLEIADTRFNAEFRKQFPDEFTQKVEDRMARQRLFQHEPQATAGRHAQLLARAAHDASQRLHLIRSPTLIVSGRHDGQASPAGQHYLRKHIANAQSLVLDGGHNLISENDRFYQAVVEFCRLHSY